MGVLASDILTRWLDFNWREMIQIVQRMITVALVLLSFLLSLPGVSEGHAFPDHSNPKVGATLTTAPVGVYIWFDGDLEPAFSTIMVHDASGKMVKSCQSLRHEAA